MKVGYLLVGVALLAMLAACTQPPQNLEQAQVQELEQEQQTINTEGATQIALDTQNSLLEFEGYGPGKSHLGTFTVYDGSVFMQNGQIVGIEGTIDASSVKSDGERLENHLRSDDFFDVEQFPTITFTNGVVSNGMLKGVLTFRGVEKMIEVPANVTESAIATEFLLDTTEFNFKYTGINKDVRIKVNFVAQV